MQSDEIIDDYPGQGGSYVIRDGRRVLVARTAPPPATDPDPAPAPAGFPGNLPPEET